MTRYLLVIFLILATSAAVPQLTTAEFQNQLIANEVIFIKFFSPSCGHCIAMAQEYELFHQKSEGKGYKVFEVDCTQDRQLCVQSGVQSYPSLQLYVSGTAFNYEGKRTSEAMSSWVEGLLQSKLTELTKEELQDKKKTQTFVLVSGLSSKSRRAIAIAKQVYNYGINYYTHQALGFIRLYKPDQQPQTYSTDYKFPISLIEWAFHKGRPALVPLESAVFAYIKKQKDFEYILGVVEAGNDDFSASLKVISDWCASHSKDIFCVRVSQDSPVYLEALHMSKAKSGQTTLLIAKNDFSIGYHYPRQAVTAQGLNQFFGGVKAEKLARAIDAKRDLEERIKFTNVLKLTRQTYKKTIAENEFVFVKYYSPSCGHCVKFAPDFEKVGTHFKIANPNIVVAALDLTNEEDGIMKEEDIRGFPHFRLFIRGKAILYRRPRSAEVMINFITDLTAAKLQHVASLDETYTKPYVTVSGIEENSYLAALAGLFFYPIYHISSEGEFSLALHDKRVKQYTGKVDFWDIVDWYDIETSPVLSSLGEPTPNKRLQKVLINHVPILLLVNKYERSKVEQTLKFLTEYCEDKTSYVCGYLHKDEPDYQIMMGWIGDSDQETNRLLWLNTEKSIKYLFEGEISQLTSEALDEFVRAVQAGEVSAFGAKEDKPQEAQAVNEQL